MNGKSLVEAPLAEFLTSGLLKGFGTALFIVLLGIDVFMQQFNDVNLLFALLSAILLGLSNVKPALRLVNGIEPSLSLTNISHIYFAAGCICFLFCQVI